MPDRGSTIDPLGLTFDEFVSACRHGHGLAIPAAGDAYKRFFREGALDLPSPVRAAIPPVTRRVTEDSPEGPITKFISEVPTIPSEPARCLGAPALKQLGTLAVESVLIPMVGRKGRRTYTLCVSSQIGCAMGCTFCETGRMGLVRSLSPAEIVSQWWNATHALGYAVSNLVFMGMGEPMDNLDAVLRAVAVLTEHRGAGLPMSKIVVSTAGRVDGIRRLARVVRTRPGWKRLNLAVSLNAPSDDVRSALMPVNRRWNLAELRRELLEWPRFGGAKLCLEYVLIPGVNDAPEHARMVAEFAAPFRTPEGKRTAMVNVIPYNPRRESPWPAPDDDAVDRFVEALAARGVFVTRRRTKGRTLMGACGQLGDERIRGRRLVAPGV
jgi:23S rRNA (adenine2503-C2)-methyltransferase